MKRFERWSSIGLPLLLVAGAVAGWLTIQQIRITPSEAQTAQESSPPPEVLWMRGQHGPPPAPPKLTPEAVLESLRKGPDGPGILEEARKLKRAGPQAQGPPSNRVRRLKGSHTPHPDFERLKALRQQEPPPKAHPMTKEEFLDYLRSLPNGPELIEKLKKQGKGTGMRPDGSGSDLSWLDPFDAQEGDGLTALMSCLNPFGIQEAMAQPTPDQAILTAASLSVGPHYFQCFGALAGNGFPPTPRIYLNPLDESATTGSRVMPYLLIAYDATPIWNVNQRYYTAFIGVNLPGVPSPPPPSVWQWDGVTYTSVPNGLANGAGWLAPDYIMVTVPITGPGMKYLYWAVPSTASVKGAGVGPFSFEFFFQCVDALNR